jgi:hypothetical protein
MQKRARRVADVFIFYNVVKNYECGHNGFLSEPEFFYIVPYILKGKKWKKS